MGTSYQTLLVAADFTATVDALRRASASAIVVPVASERVAVVPQEDSYWVAELEPLATSLSAALHRPVLAMWVCDSDFVEFVTFEKGEPVHRYVSDQAMTVEWFEDDDGTFKPRIDGVLYPQDHSLPEGPLGAEADAFASFALQPPDLERIGAALRGEIDGGGARRLMAERQHREIIAALGLTPAPLTKGYRHMDPADFPAAVVVP